MFFWRDLKTFACNSINFSYENNQLSVSQRRGIITLIPKGDKDKLYLKNWRPLTLLNTLYKLTSGTIAERIKPCLETIIHPDQKGFVPNRYIGECIRTTYDILEYAKTHNKTGLILLIDFEKAYDSISFKYIKKCLAFFNFGESIIKWVGLLLGDFSAVINNCGNISKQFDISRGCRQGDPIASFLFIICVEILAHKLRNDVQIKGFEIGTRKHVLEAYADDITIFLAPNEQNLRDALDVLSSFYNLSGLSLNIEKTNAVWFGSGYNNAQLCPDIKLEWTKEFKLLGVYFDSYLQNMEINFDKKLNEIRKLLGSWFNRQLTPFGKITVIKSLALSKLSHIALVVPTLNKKMIKDIKKMFYNFIWNNKPDKVRRDDAELPNSCGGLSMVSVEKFWKSFKFSWFKRIINTNAFWPSILEHNLSLVTNTNFDLFRMLHDGPSKLNQYAKLIKNNFWKEVLMSAAPMLEGAIFSFPEKFLLSPFWENPLIKRSNKVIKPNNFPSIANKVTKVGDFFKNGETEIMLLEDFNIKYSTFLTFEQYIDIRYILGTAMHAIGIRKENIIAQNEPSQPLLLNIAMQSVKGCSTYYKILNKKSMLKNEIHLRETFWHRHLNCMFSVDFWKNTWKSISYLKYENQLKWLQYQIARGSLKVNHVVNKFKNHVSPLCTYCGNHPETVPHLFWTCEKVYQFWDGLTDFLIDNGIFIPFKRNKILFGIHKEPSDSVNNFIILCAKQYIWKNKFRDTPTPLTLAAFINMLIVRCTERKNMADMLKDFEQAQEWSDLLLLL